MSFRAKVVSLLLYILTRILCSTLRVHLVGQNQIDEMREKYGGVVIATWHGRTLIPIVLFSRRGYTSMVSTSRDGEFQHGLLTRYGFQTIRGSSSARGAVAGALRLAKTINKGEVLAMTPDGPRGPSHVVHSGTIFIAEKSGCPIIPFGSSAYPRVQLTTWDGYLIPKFFAKAAVVFGEPIIVPSHLDEEGRREYGEILAERLNSVEAEAEALVTVGDTNRTATVL